MTLIPNRIFIKAEDLATVQVEGDIGQDPVSKVFFGNALHFQQRLLLSHVATSQKLNTFAYGSSRILVNTLTTNCWSPRKRCTNPAGTDCLTVFVSSSLWHSIT